MSNFEPFEVKTEEAGTVVMAVVAATERMTIVVEAVVEFADEADAYDALDGVDSTASTRSFADEVARVMVASMTIVAAKMLAEEHLFLVLAKVHG